MGVVEKLRNPDFWIQHCLNDLYFFCRCVLKTLEDSTPGFKDLYKPTHKRLCDFISEYAQPGQKLLILLPRGWIKSYIITVGWTTQKLLQNLVSGRREHWIISNATIANAKEFLAKIKYNLQYNEILTGLFREYLPKNPDEEAERWTQDEIQLRGCKIETGSVEGNLVSRHYKVMLNDDLVNRDNSATREQIEKVIDWWKLAQSLLMPDSLELLIGCLPADSRVLMADGSEKYITDIQPGERVLSANAQGFFDSLKPQIVEAVIPQGKQVVFRVKTCAHTLEATANHPFLTTTRGFVRLDKLKIGEKIKIGFYYDLGQEGYTKEELWVLGYMYGDGWVGKDAKRYYTCVAKSVYDDRNNKIVNFLKSFGNVYDTSCGYYRIDTRAAYEYFTKLGFNGNAKTKRIPTWVYGLTSELKEEFLNGLLEADGWKGKYGDKHLEISNLELIRDVKRLAESCGYKVSNIHRRIRLIKAPNSKTKKTSTTYHVNIGYRQWKKRIRWERIKSIEVIGEKEVYDLTVANTHNFIANGFIVHNTRWDMDDLYGYVIENFLQIPSEKRSDWFIEWHNGRYHLFQMSAYDDKGRSTFPILFPNYRLKEIELAQADRFGGQYLNDPLSMSNKMFQAPWFRTWRDGDIPDVVNTIMTVDPTGKEKTSSDYTGIIVGDAGCDKKFYVKFASSKLVTDLKLAEWIIEVALQFQPGIIGIEENKFNVLVELIELILPRIAKEGKIPTHLRDYALTIANICVELKHRNRNKEMRVKNLTGWIESGRMLFAPSGMTGVKDELLRFPAAKRDDMADALAYVLDILIFPSPADSPKSFSVPDDLKKTTEERLREEWESYPDTASAVVQSGFLEPDSLY